MICIKCNETGIQNQALGKEFWYCRTCKEEIQLNQPSWDKPKGITSAIALQMLDETPMTGLAAWLPTTDDSNPVPLSPITFEDIQEAIRQSCADYDGDPIKGKYYLP